MVCEDHACPTAGSCQGLFTANTMAILTETLGMSLVALRHGSGRLLPETAHRFCLRGADRRSWSREASPPGRS